MAALLLLLAVDRRFLNFCLLDQLGQPFGKLRIRHLLDELAIAGDLLIELLANGAHGNHVRRG